MRVLIFLLCALCATAHAQQVYRCGSTYSQTPCGAVAKEIPISTGDRPQTIESIQADLAKTKRLLTTKIPDVATSPELVEANKRTCTQIIRSSMKDPESARIGDVSRVGAANSYYAGKNYQAVSYTALVNGKNSYGGYVGEKPYYCEFSMDEKTFMRIYSDK
jgi:hypothetical protein